MASELPVEMEMESAGWELGYEYEITPPISPIFTQKPLRLFIKDIQVIYKGITFTGDYFDD